MWLGLGLADLVAGEQRRPRGSVGVDVAAAPPRRLEDGGGLLGFLRAPRAEAVEPAQQQQGDGEDQHRAAGADAKPRLHSQRRHGGRQDRAKAGGADHVGEQAGGRDESQEGDCQAGQRRDRHAERVATAAPEARELT